ncbi:glutathione S-transferase N-terminal domain-containing protein [Sphingobium sp. CR2-8]|uniref:glutathione S-transferase N-terminal domain-containing protein n=1 Tax=Sphingobium sp. CR2-8 TaxID=1306534 RepID=UPI002DB6B6D9|nr:glutathione S-transferase N-terminal domain-containing protein [Sphingobium sp. CR2-8]MEC3909486.1 glutathione S-transferase N-terminal domain-containing protein [Sphingobium sp. CR2-8]
MKIYDREAAPHPARIRIVLAEKGLGEHVEFVSIDLIAAEQKQPEFLAMNPIGKIPVLELEDGTIISESTAITEYLDNLDGNPILTGKSVAKCHGDPVAHGVVGSSCALLCENHCRIANVRDNLTNRVSRQGASALILPPTASVT